MHELLPGWSSSAKAHVVGVIRDPNRVVIHSLCLPVCADIDLRDPAHAVSAALHGRVQILGPKPPPSPPHLVDTAPTFVKAASTLVGTAPHFAEPARSLAETPPHSVDSQPRQICWECLPSRRHRIQYCRNAPTDLGDAPRTKVSVHPSVR